MRGSPLEPHVFKKTLFPSYFTTIITFIPISHTITTPKETQSNMNQTVNFDGTQIAQLELKCEGNSSDSQVRDIGAYKANEDLDDSYVRELGVSLDAVNMEDAPTEEELRTLRRVSGKIHWAAYTIAFCEAAERFSYYDSTSMCNLYFSIVLAWFNHCYFCADNVT